MSPSPSAARAELSLADQSRLVAALQRTLQQQHASVETIETHISFVLVAGARAYKLKKAVNPGFLDFTTLARRQHFCAEELRLNRRLAPALYLDVVPIVGTVDAPVLGGDGAPIEFAVAMRAFDQAGLWDRMARRGALRLSHVDALARAIERLHRDAAAATGGDGWGTPEHVRAPMRDTLRFLRQRGGGAAIGALNAWEARAFNALAPTFAQRRREGRVRECHGDLHLGNVAEVDGRSTAFDGIEFDPALRWIDVASEVAFMAMDLRAHMLPALAHRFVNAYFERSGDYGALRCWRYYFAYRALVRAKVAALRSATDDALPREAEPYLALAASCIDAARPALIVTHGFAGSGKTTATQSLVEEIGAVRIRSDVERKRLAGLDALAQTASAPGGGLYAAASTAATYERLLALAAPVLDGGTPVVLDATFLGRAQREAARALARRRDVPFVILDFDVAPATLRERVRRRTEQGGDASEADLRVLQSQLDRAEPLAGDERGDVVAADAALADRWGELGRRIGA